MKAVKYSDDIGNQKLLCVSKSDFENRSIGDSIGGLELKVITSPSTLEKEEWTFKGMPVVHLNKTHSETISRGKIIGPVTVLNGKLLSQERIMFYPGMQDVFFLTKVKEDRASGWQTAGEDYFGFYDPETGDTREEVDEYCARLNVTREIHRTLQLKRNTSVDGVPMTYKMYRKIVETWLQCTINHEEFNDYEYNILPDRRGRQVKVVKTKLVVNVKDVVLFENCFGYDSTLKHDCPMRKLNKLLSFAAITGLFVCKKKDDSEFETMTFKFDPLAKKCEIHFHSRNGEAKELNEYIAKKQQQYAQMYSQLWTPVVPNTVVVDFYPAAGRKENKKRSADLISISVDKAKIRSVFTDCAGDKYEELPVVGYIAGNICNHGGETVKEAANRLLAEYRDCVSIDIAIKSMKFDIDLTLEKKVKVAKFVDELQLLYNAK